MELKDALDGTANRQERDSIESIVVTKRLTTNFSLSNVRIGIQTKNHPMPYDPANFHSLIATLTRTHRAKQRSMRMKTTGAEH